MCTETLRMSILELIETLWNVNQFVRIGLQRGILELIETLWNVNWGANAYAKKRISELIETLWNVNQHHLSQHTLHI